MSFEIQKVGVIGAGQMGNGIAQVCAQAGIKVSMFDISAERIQAGLATINGNLSRQVGRQVITEAQRKLALEHISAAPDYAAFSDCDLVIEAASEN